MKFRVEIEVPPELEGAIQQYGARMNISGDPMPTLVADATLFALRRISEAIPLDDSLLASLERDWALKGEVRERIGHLLMTIEKEVVNAGALHRCTQKLVSNICPDKTTGTGVKED